MALVICPILSPNIAKYERFSVESLRNRKMNYSPIIQLDWLGLLNTVVSFTDIQQFDISNRKTWANFLQYFPDIYVAIGLVATIKKDKWPNRMVWYCFFFFFIYLLHFSSQICINFSHGVEALWLLSGSIIFPSSGRTDETFSLTSRSLDTCIGIGIHTCFRYIWCLWISIS